MFQIALFLKFFEKKQFGEQTDYIHEKNGRFNSVVTKQKMNFVVVERIK